MKITVKRTEILMTNLRTRMPFKYGIATLTAVPHLVVRMSVKIDGAIYAGISADNLPPKWFTKNPDQSFADELNEMSSAIQSAAGLAQQADVCASAFELWDQVYTGQKEWGEKNNLPPLLWNFGVSLIERAIIDAVCKAVGMTFAEAVRSDTLGIEFGRLNPKLKGIRPADILPLVPLRKIFVRHTVGLSDPLTEEDIPEEERVSDDLPQSLRACIRHYNIRYFKIKLSGNVEGDTDRLKRIVKLIEEEGIRDYHFTLDGNEQYTEVASLRSFWEKLIADRQVATFLSRLIVMEQPFHRKVALSEDLAGKLRTWNEHPPLIIDESDATLDSLSQALRAGYSGTSHKNCKGVIKGLYNKALLDFYGRENHAINYTLTAEDLTNIGPIALNQDLAVISTLGIEHAERNGHHYFHGLRFFNENIGNGSLEAHNDLYEETEGTTIVRIRNGALKTGSVVDAPFGVGFEPDLSEFVPLDQWRFDSLHQI